MRIPRDRAIRAIRPQPYPLIAARAQHAVCLELRHVRVAPEVLDPLVFGAFGAAAFGEGGGRGGGGCVGCCRRRRRCRRRAVERVVGVGVRVRLRRAGVRVGAGQVEVRGGVRSVQVGMRVEAVY